MPPLRVARLPDTKAMKAPQATLGLRHGDYQRIADLTGYAPATVREVARGRRHNKAIQRAIERVRRQNAYFRTRRIVRRAA